MTNRWAVLALLFSVRMTMAFQFQAVAAMSPLIMSEYGVGLADIGLLIGLYLMPGLALSYPGGALGKRFGEKPLVQAGLVMMVVGGLAVVIWPQWEMQVAGRLIAGVGGAILNVLMAKMVADWFAGREIATAMGIFVNSWPAGIAVALMILPLIAEATGLTGALVLVVVLAIAGFLALTFLYRSPTAPSAATSGGAHLRGARFAAILAAALIWAFYNAALHMVFGFGPAMLSQRGWSMAGGGSMTSVVLWLLVVSVPVGGYLADRTGRTDLIIVVGMLAFAAMLVVATRSDAVLLSFAVLGLLAGLTPGPIMSLPAAILTPQTGAIGMGIFFTLFYAIVVIAPYAAGFIATWTGSAGSAFDFGALLLVAGVACLWPYRYYTKSLEQQNGRDGHHA